MHAMAPATRQLMLMMRVEAFCLLVLMMRV